MYALYRIECETPNHFYVGISQKLSKRIEAHRRHRGAVFTRKHGLKTFKVISLYQDEVAAKSAEMAEVRKLLAEGKIARGGGFTRS
jgi:predicted GIY-YIG superfamily endonuclease